MTDQSSIKYHQRFQQTLCNPVSFSGIGLHTGEKVELRFCPAAIGEGIQFERVDLPSRPRIPATVEYVLETARSTTIGLPGVKIHTVEHVLSALRAYQIDNCIIEISSIEPPIANGSSDVFVEMIEEAGIKTYEATRPVLSLKNPVWFSEGDIHMVALPYDGYKISYTLSYPDSKILKEQFFSTDINPENYKREIAPCRTFSLYEEISILLDRGLIKGGSLDNAVVIKEDVVLSKNGLYFPNEMVRHKILDVIGDLSLVGIDFSAHIISIRSGHAANVAFAKKIYQSLV